MAKIFLAASFTGMLTPDGGLKPDFRESLKLLVAVLRRNGHDVFSAHERESWGLDIDTPAYALEDDLEKLRACDLLVALMSTPPSPGVQLEIGAATVLKKRILVLALTDSEIPFLIRGLSAVAAARVHVYRVVDEIPGLVEEALR